jgi:hypothetical protein
MWIYAQKTGALLRNGKATGVGYSGFDNGKNSLAMQAVPNVGPIPQGSWTIVGPPFNSPGHGPYVLRLEARGCASRGCIILPRAIRELVWQSGDTVLEVVAEFQTQDQGCPTPPVRSRQSQRKIGIRKLYA